MTHFSKKKVELEPLSLAVETHHTLYDSQSSESFSQIRKDIVPRGAKNTGTGTGMGMGVTDPKTNSPATVSISSSVSREPLLMYNTHTGGGGGGGSQKNIININNSSPEMRPSSDSNSNTATPTKNNSTNTHHTIDRLVPPSKIHPTSNTVKSISSDDKHNSQSHTSTEDFSPASLEIKNSDWRQLRCKTKTLRFSKTIVLCIYANLCWIALVLGGVTAYFTQSVVLQEFEPYSELSDCQIAGFNEHTEWGKVCTVNYTIDYDFPTPIYFYYKLTNVFQNHRRYVQSRSDLQLNGEKPSEVATCEPMTEFVHEKLVPCGLIAYSFFNDKYNVTHIDGKTGVQTPLCPFTAESCTGDERKTNWSAATWHYKGTWENENVPWESDKKEKFKRVHLKDGWTNAGELQTWQNITLPDTDDSDLMVWMRTATDSTFTKLHRINRHLKFKEGDRLMVKIYNYFDVSEFHGTKSLVIATTGIMGSQSYALTIGFFAISGLSFIAFAVFFWCIPQDRVSPYKT